MGKLKVVVGGQYGSEAKGACTAHLAKRAAERDLNVGVIRVAGPNAGHTAYDQDSRKWALRQIPVAAVVNDAIELFIGAGSEIDLDVLLTEIHDLEAAGIPITNRLTIDPQATIIDPEHKQLEAEMVGRIGSTGKGIGAARAARLMRTAKTVADYEGTFRNEGIQVFSLWKYLAEIYGGPLHDSTLLIEGTQGYGLGLHAGHYPQCTSSNARAIDFCAMAGVDPVWFSHYEVWVVARTYPIRVAGNSGPLKGETSWEELGFEPEKTTVTQKIRRVGQWDPELIRDAVLANGGPSVVKISLSMADYVVPALKGVEATWTDLAKGIALDRAADWMDDLTNLIKRVEHDAGAPVYLVGTGPQTFLDVSI